jgi:hypothetical protein
LIIRGDPRSPATPAAYAAQFALAMRIRDRLSAANDAVKTIRNVAYQIQTDSADAPTGFMDVASPFEVRLRTIESELYQVKNRSSQDPLNFPIKLNNEIAALAGTVASAQGRPTAPTYAVFDTLSVQLDKELAALKTVIVSDLPKLNAILKAAGRPEIVPRAEEPPRAKKPTITAAR